jgi:hypothetical protein
MIPASWLYRILGAALAAAPLLWLVQTRDHWRDRARARTLHTAKQVNFPSGELQQ